MKLACVVHRYGPEIAGGSEGHCRLFAERLAERHDVTVLTTTARDHVSWRNEHPPGRERVGAVNVVRFPVVRQRAIREFADLSEHVFSGDASLVEQEEWFRANGPEAPDLLAHLTAHGTEYDWILFWAFRYYQSFFGVPLVADRAVLLPTAEDDPAIRMAILSQLFSKPAGLVYLTPEERELVESKITGRVPPSCVIGAGLDPARSANASELAQVGVTPPYVLYLGRVDPNKGCQTLRLFFTRWADATSSHVTLVLAGPPNMPVPTHPAVRPLGFVGPALRDALLANASLLVMPSPYESLSMVLLEAWNRGVPALVNARCQVLKGQAQRSGGALYYRNYDEFAAALGTLVNHPSLGHELGAAGLVYVERHYRWPRVLSTLESFLASLSAFAKPSAGPRPAATREP
jgi:glycosyltransferase involved in cell wall biosynthesis